MTSGVRPGGGPAGLAEVVDKWLAGHESDLIDTRHDIHQHPEIAHEEHRVTDLIVRRLKEIGLAGVVLSSGTGVICDIGSGGRVIALRADIDALSLPDLKDVPYKSQVPGVCHACGHDAHTAILLGVAEVLAELAGNGGLPGTVRLLFQPAEEHLPGGALEVIANYGMRDVEQVFALHCDPRIDVGLIGVRAGPITAASDSVEVRLSGPGGHTGRPQLTVELVYALGRVITDLPGLLSRRVDPRTGLSMVWGSVEAGQADNAIPSSGVARGTVRLLDRNAWDGAESIVRALVEQIVVPTGAHAEVTYLRGVPPVVNDPASVEVQRAAVVAALGAAAVTGTEQSMGGEDFAWYLDHAPGALGRLGVHTPGAQRVDLHQSAFDIDERALAIGVRFMTTLAVMALHTPLR
jgi:amidohydrolase